MLLDCLLLIVIGGLLGLLAPAIAYKLFYGSRPAETVMKVIGVIASVAGVLLLIGQL